MPKTIALLFLAISLAAVHQEARALTPTIDEVKDSRTTGQFFANCEVSLNLVGDEIGDAMAIRTVLSAATDDTGRDIRLVDESADELQEISEYSRNKVTLKFKNPARKAVVIKDITGQIDLFIPKNDPLSVVEIPQALAQSGKKISSPVLSQNGIEITLYTADGYASFLKAKAEKEAAAQGMKDALGGMFGGMFGGGDKNDITFIIKDPRNRIALFGLYDASGTAIRNNGSMSSRNAGEAVKTLSYSDIVAADAKLKIFVATEKSMMKIPLKLADVALP